MTVFGLSTLLQDVYTTFSFFSKLEWDNDLNRSEKKSISLNTRPCLLLIELEEAYTHMPIFTGSLLESDESIAD